MMLQLGLRYVHLISFPCPDTALLLFIITLFALEDAVDVRSSVVPRRKVEFGSVPLDLLSCSFDLH
jgi:hypothetical protein